MSRARPYLLVPAALLAWGCSEATAPVTRPSDVLSANVAATFSRDDDDDDDRVKAADHDANGRLDRGGPLDVHAVNVDIRSKPFGATVIDQYSFHVHGRPGDMKGNFKLYQIRIIDGETVAVVVASGRMDCGTVVGNKAHTGGTITETTFPEPGGLPVGGQLTWTVTDKGRGSGSMDTASQPLGFNALAHCLAPAYQYPEQLLDRGQVKIRG